MSDKNISNEEQRIASLQSYHILDTAAEKDFDDLTQLASAVCDTPISLISFVDSDRQWFKSNHGLEVSETDRCHSFCSHAIQNPEILMQIEDAQLDARFQDNPLVTGEPKIRFYAGMPLLDTDGHALGSLCVIDHKPRILSEKQKLALQILADQVIDKLMLRKNRMDLLQANEQLTQTNRDLTETEKKLKDTNSELAESKLRLQTILDILGEGIGITDENGNIVYTNRRNREIFKAEEQQMLTLNHASPEWKNSRSDGTPLPLEEHPITVALKTGEPVVNFEYQVKDQMGNAVYLRMNTTPIKDEKGTVTGAVASFADITGSFLLQQKLQEREESLRMAISSANLGTWYINAGTREFIPSLRLKELFGFYPDEEMPYDAAVMQIAESHRAQVLEAVEAAINVGQPYELEYPIIGYHDKKTRWVCATGNLVHRPGNPEIAHFSGTVADITERKLNEQRRSDFVGMVSHELRNPLTAINGYTHLLKRWTGKGETAKTVEIADKITSQIKRMESLINGFLEAARLGEGMLQLNKTSFDMAKLIRLAEEESLTTVTTHKVIFEPLDYTPLEADQDKIEQVLINFISNAAKYSPTGTEIHVSCIKKDGEIHVSVKDEGMGISEEDQRHIFDRYFRVDNEEMKNKTGFGMGLYICKEIIERHQGNIGVESTRGEGSNFWFTLPIAVAT